MKLDNIYGYLYNKKFYGDMNAKKYSTATDFPPEDLKVLCKMDKEVREGKINAIALEEAIVTSFKMYEHELKGK